MTNSPNLILPYINPAQAQPTVTANMALQSLDAQVQLSVLDRTLTAPPSSPADGDRHLVATGGTGAWAGWDHNIAAYQSGAWYKYVPREGWLCWVAAESLALVYHSGAWVNAFAPGGGTASWTAITSNTAGVTFSFASGYRMFQIRFSNALPDISGCALCLQFSTNGGSTWISTSSDYDYETSYTSYTTSASTGSSGNIFIPLTQFAQGASSGKELAGTLEVYDPLTAGTRKAVTSRSVMGNNVNAIPTNCTGNGTLISSTSACNACQLAYFDSGGTQHNIAQGLFSIIGV